MNAPSPSPAWNQGVQRRRRHRVLGAVVVALLACGAALLRRHSDAAVSSTIAAGVPPAQDGAPDNGTSRGAAARRALLGEVTTAEGKPIGGCVVRATLDDGAVEEAVTNAAGSFFLDGLPSAPRELSFRARGFRDVVVGRGELPGVPEAFWSQVLLPTPAAAGSAAEDARAHVDGTVVTREGTPIRTFRVVVSRSDDRRGAHRPTVIDVNEDGGRFTVPLEPGRISISIVADGFRPRDPVLIELAEGETEEVRVVLEASAELRGRVTDAETGRPVAGARVRLVGMRGLAPTSTDQDGRFVIGSLPEENANLVVTADGYVVLNAGGVDGRRSRDQVVELALTPARAGVASEVVGIGAAIEDAPEGVRVRAVYPGSPAAGVLAVGDVIVEVDGIPARGHTLRDTMGAIRGQEGSSVRLTVVSGSGQRREVSLERRRVAVPAEPAE